MKRIFPLLASAAPFLVILSALGLALAWTLAPVRILVLSFAGNYDMISAEAGLDDPDSEVAAVACTQLLRQEDRAVSDAVVQRLGERPEVAMRCLEKAADIAPAAGADPADPESSPTAAADSTLVPLYALLGARLGERWMQELVRGDAQSCATATNVRRALEYARMEPNHGLLSCAVGAQTETARQCCIEGLGGEDAFKTLLGQPDLHPLGQAATHLGAFVEAAFPSGASTPDTPDTPGAKEAKDSDAADKEASAKKKAKSAKAAQAAEARFGALQTPVQDWVVQVSCRLHIEDPNSLRVIQAYVPLIESPECAPTEPPGDGYYSTLNWSAMCQGLYDYRRLELDESPRTAICHSLERTTIAQAIQGGRIGVNAAVASAARLPGASPAVGTQFLANSRARRRKARRRSITHTTNGRKGARVLNAFFRSIVAP